MKAHMLSSEVLIEDLTTRTTIGELAKLATVTGVDAIIEREEGSYSVRLKRYETDSTDLFDELVNLFMVESVTSGRTGNDLITALTESLRRRHFPLDRPIEDVMSIGGGPEHEGHEH